MRTYTQKTICPYNCPASCDFTVHTDGKQILKTEGDWKHPVSQGILCGKMRRYEEELHSKNRILLKASTLPAAIPPIPSATKSNWNTIILLDKAMGYTDSYFKATEEEMYEKLIKAPTPLSARLTEEEQEKLLEGGVISMPFADHTDFKTPDKKFYIVNPSLPEPMPRYTESYGDPEDLMLISVPSKFTLNSIVLSCLPHIPELLHRKSNGNCRRCPIRNRPGIHHPVNPHKDRENQYEGEQKDYLPRQRHHNTKPGFADGSKKA